MNYGRHVQGEVELETDLFHLSRIDDIIESPGEDHRLIIQEVAVSVHASGAP